MQEAAIAEKLYALLGAPALRSIRVFGTASPYWGHMDRLLKAGIPELNKETS